MFESIKLKGTFVKTIKLARSGATADLSSYNNYLIYDHTYKKYYLLQLGSSQRFIAVAEDLTELYQLLKDPKLSLVGDSKELDKELTSLRAFALKTMQALTEIGKARFNMPWRWRPWSANYL